MLWPRHCIVCDVVLDAESREDICDACLDDLPLTWFWAFSPNPAEERMLSKVGIIAAASLYFYRQMSPYPALVKSVKYGGRDDVGRKLGHMLGERIKTAGRFATVDAVVPVPLHPIRRWKRGHNQAEDIARGIAEAIGVRLVPNLLKRSRYTKTQTKLTGKEKAANVRHAFAINAVLAEKIQKEGVNHILLVDDVMTSGATLAEAATPLTGHFLVSIATAAFVE